MGTKNFLQICSFRVLERFNRKQVNLDRNKSICSPFSGKGNVMAFVNERILEEQRMEYQINESRKENPSSWTIDKDKNVKFFRYWTDIDNPSQKYFALIWKGRAFEVRLKSELCKPNAIKWDLMQISLPKELENSKNEILQDLREALLVYGFEGFKIHPPNYKGISGETIINF